MDGQTVRDRSLARLALSGMISAAICAYLAWMPMETKFARLDASILRFVVEHRTEWVTGAMQLVTWLGSRWVLGPLVMVVGGFFLLGRRDWRPGTRLVAALGGALVLQVLLGRVVGRVRPPPQHWIAVYTGPSFPSLHATMTISVYGMLSVILSCNRSHRARTVIWSVAALVALVVGASRIYLGAHWLTDVLGGYALGAAWLSFLLALTSLARMPPERP